MIIVYCANKTLYDKLPTALNSLFKYNYNDISKVYLIIEDDNISYINDPKIEFINILKTKLDIIQDNFNCISQFTYMALARCYLTKILKEDKILYLDVDTVVTGSIQELWNTSINNVCLAGTPEREQYLNSGVLLMNLGLIRSRKEDDNLIRLIKICRFQYPDQDAINIVFHDSMKFLDYKWNRCGKPNRAYSEPYVIRHFAGIVKPWQEKAYKEDVELWEKYKVDKISSKG